ncbi:V4R domain-containing protein [Dictyobacter kobayashii]|uniref:Uncharacterized protein n=1 Tax=Dictyobacter kobayashii TaxID=2014872 RepID=A0A402AV68_9CHLR|nr:V4R domain-containing protein [Dictyobacter kobayashii]GCE22984.1 hypothetical protein KDK_67840 [Dictyobacter kobayashii]
MNFAAKSTAAGIPGNPIAKAQEHTLLLIDTDEMRAQNLASVLTLAGLRAIVVPNTYQAFERFLQQRFKPELILLGQPEERSTQLFARFFQRLIQEFQQETPILSSANFQLADGNLLLADTFASTSVHVVSQRNSEVLKKIWRVLPSTQISLKLIENPIVLEPLSRLGLLPRVTQKKLSIASHFHDQLKAARRIILDSQWDNLMTDVGLAQFRKEENWPAATEQYIIPPEYTTCLNRAVMFSNPEQPAQQAYTWANQVDADILQRVALIFLLQQAPKVIGKDLTMRTMLNAFVNEINSVRGEKLADWKRLEDGSFIFVFYSNLFAYGFMGAEQPTCYVWQASFDKMLELGKQQKYWHVREIECSSQSHTGHCAFLFTPRSA